MKRSTIVTAIRTETEISGARFHRAGHVINVPHVQKTTVISAPVLTWLLVLGLFAMLVDLLVG